MQNRLWRRLWHLCGGLFFPVLAFFLPREALLWSLGIITAVFMVWEIARLTSSSVNRWMVSHLGFILKGREYSCLTGTTWLLLSSLAVFLFFDKYVAITALLFVAVGDLVAAVVGGRYTKRRIFNKSLAGSLACFLSCLLIGLVMTKVSPSMVLPVVTAGAVTATVIELLPAPADDNLTIPVFSAGIMALTAFHLDNL